MRARPLRSFTAALCWGAAATATFALAQAAPPAHSVPDTMAQRVQACTTCHGKEGVATNQGYLPRIAGKPAGYLYNQLLNFRDGRRGNATMSSLVENLSENYLMEIANHFASRDLPYPPPPAVQASRATAQEMARGEVLVKLGDAARRLPACVQCHGQAMTGVAPAIPGLLGLPKDYLLAQLGAWRTGLRKTASPDCMAQVVARMSPEDIGAAASWLASRPVPGDGKPVARSRSPLPLECGSAPP